MRSMVTFFLMFLAAHVLLSSKFAFAESSTGDRDRSRESIAGSKVTLVPPPGFDPATNFIGFFLEDLNSSIMVTELPVPSFLFQSELTAEKLATRGMLLRSTEEASFGNREGILITAAQGLEGVTYLKYMGIFGDDAVTFMVVGTYPEDYSEEVGEAIRTSVLSAEFEADAQVDIFDGLTFHLEETTELKIGHRIGNVVMLTKDGSRAAGPEDPLMVVGSAFREMKVDDLERFCRDRIMATAHVKDVQIHAVRPAVVDGRKGLEISATAKDEDSETMIELYQVIVFNGEIYYIIQGIVGKMVAPRYLPEFRRVTDSMTITGE